MEPFRHHVHVCTQEKLGADPRATEALLNALVALEVQRFPLRGPTDLVVARRS